MKAMQSDNYRLAPWVSIILAVVCAGLGMWGAWEWGLKLEKNTVNYLAVASPVIALVAALIPPLAESDWRHGHKFKSVMFWLVLLPCAAVVFFSSAERVHLAKAGAEAERAAGRMQVERLRKDLDEAKAEAKVARQDDAKVKGGKDRGEKRDKDKKAANNATKASERVSDMEQKLAVAEAKATTEAEFKAPEWLLPVSLDLAAFILMWSGLSGLSRAVVRVQSTATAKKEKPQSKEPPAPRRSVRSGPREDKPKPEPRPTLTLTSAGRKAVKAKPIPKSPEKRANAAPAPDNARPSRRRG